MSVAGIDFGPIAQRYDVLDAFAPAGPFLARDKADSKAVALHIFPTTAKDAGGPGLSVVEPLLTFQHPRVLPTRYVVEHQGAVCVVSDLKEGANVAAALLAMQAPMPALLVARVLLDVLNALGAIHKAGLAHGSLTTSSILLGRDGGAHIVDLPRAILDRRGANGDARADLMQAGLAALEMLGSERTDRPPLVIEICPGAPANLERAIERLVRPGDCRLPAAIDELQRLVKHIDPLQPDPIGNAARDPATLRARLVRVVAQAEMERAMRLYNSGDPAQRKPAVWALYRAACTDLSLTQARDAFQAAMAAREFTLAPSTNPRITSTEARIADAPYGVLKTTAEAYLAENHLLGAVRMYKRALRLKPDDVPIWDKLRQLIGEDDGTEPFSLAAHPSGAFLEDLPEFEYVEPVHRGDRPDEEGEAGEWEATSLSGRLGGFASKLTDKLRGKTKE